MNKKEVSGFLGRSTRLVEQYASEGKLGEEAYVRSKTGDQADYNWQAIEKLKAELQSPNPLVSNTSPEEPYAEDLRGLFSILLEEVRSQSVRTSEKLLLNINDCRLLTGLSDSLLKKAIKNGTLKAKIIGRAYKVKRQDLNDFITNL